MKRLLCAAFLTLAATLPFIGLGCGPGLSKVECKVTLDGEPVAEATVNFMPEDKGGLQASGMTDAQGMVTLKTGDKEGVRAGKYKVFVSKTSHVQGLDDPNMSMADKMKQATGGGGGPPGAGGGGPPGGGKKMPGGMMPGGGAGGPGGPGGPGNMGVKREELLPGVYNTDKTPLSVTVPVSETVKLELKKNP
jgi:hypothetical protein